ncbi:MAG: type I restriction enzyme HsdR N-terminal domain-containing protein [Ignavibacteriaceae bacterium]|nr:type I restriction enzyme HsdR N-terminal domain-containing protein [Ignavibacteriaceae bacterium]
MPFINILGYNVFNPTEVVPEFTADVGIKKGEKVDYAIFNDGKCVMLIECKPVETNLNKEHMNQLLRYFSVTETRLGVLTNGIKYKFYTDLEISNKMDEKPFLEIDLLSLNDSIINELKKLTKSKFNIDEVISSASELKFLKEIKILLNDQLINPSEDFVKFIGGKIYQGRMTQAVKEQITEIVKKGFNQFINDKINETIKKALVPENTQPVPEETPSPQDEAHENENQVITTADEMEGYYIVKSVLREIIDPKRVVMRDTMSYCGILLDDNNRKPIIRLRFNTSQKYLGLMNKDKSEQKVVINDLNEIYKYASQMIELVNFYLEEKTK